MKTISVSASGQYDIILGRGLLDHVGESLSKIRTNCKAAIISDSNVWPIYGERVERSLLAAGIHSESFVFPAGEQSKTAETYLDIIQFMAQNRFDRSDIIIALGGGVVGDIAGFSAATYLRGISYVQIPTSLLAMVDSSVGGKTGIDLPEGKNLLGAFKQPCMVVCDVDLLDTLPRQYYLDGCAEIIKYGMLYDEELIDYLLNDGPGFDRESIIGKCIEYKRDAVQADEFDSGLRQFLNFGHTIGHGIEAASNYALSHGKCVAIGMGIVTRAAVRNGLCSYIAERKLTSLLDAFSLPATTQIPSVDFLKWILQDKKRIGSNINIIIPHSIGVCEIYPIPIHEMESFVKAGL